MSQHYTLATYRVVPGKEDDFVRRWHELAAIFIGLPNPPHWAVLVRSTRDPTLCHSFGPWESADHIAAMRKSGEALATFKALQELCIEMMPGDYEVVAHVRVHEGKNK
jgi:heme-degrading monooxygenase HmoA